MSSFRPNRSFTTSVMLTVVEAFTIASLIQDIAVISVPLYTILQISLSPPH